MQLLLLVLCFLYFLEGLLYFFRLMFRIVITLLFWLVLTGLRRSSYYEAADSQLCPLARLGNLDRFEAVGMYFFDDFFWTS